MIKQFDFKKDDMLGWVGYPSSGIQIAGWTKYRGTHTAPPASNYVGRIRFSSDNGAPGGFSYIIWEGTWENLGVPSGTNVVSVKLSYYYKWMQTRHGSDASFYGTDSTAGPATLLNSSGTVIGTFSDENYCTDRINDEKWISFPGGSNVFSNTSDSWFASEGSSITIDSSHKASSTPIKFKIGYTAPDMVTDSVIQYGKTTLRFNISNVKIEITTASGITYNATFFGSD